MFFDLKHETGHVYIFNTWLKSWSNLNQMFLLSEPNHTTGCRVFPWPFVGSSYILTKGIREYILVYINRICRKQQTWNKNIQECVLSLCCTTTVTTLKRFLLSWKQSHLIRDWQIPWVKMTGLLIYTLRWGLNVSSWGDSAALAE